MAYPSSSSQDVKVAIEAKSTNRSVRCFLMICCIVWLFLICSATVLFAAAEGKQSVEYEVAGGVYHVAYERCYAVARKGEARDSYFDFAEWGLVQAPNGEELQSVAYGKSDEEQYCLTRQLAVAAAEYP